MKTLIVAVMILAASSIAFAQVENLLEGDIESGGFGGPVLKVSSLAGSTGVFVGGRGGWILNHSFILGGGGYGLVNYVKAATPGPNGEPYINLGYGGVELEYVHNWEKLVHYSLGLLVGGGGVGFRGEFNSGDVDMRGFFVMEPWAQINVNIVEFFRISGGVSYRWITGADSPVATDGKLSGVAGVLTLRFGSF